MKNNKINDRQLEIILNSIADGVFTIDLKKNITSFNRAAEKITGIPGEQAIGQKCFDVFHASICQSACAIDKTIKTGKQIEHSCREADVSFGLLPHGWRKMYHYLYYC